MMKIKHSDALLIVVVIAAASSLLGWFMPFDARILLIVALGIWSMMIAKSHYHDMSALTLFSLFLAGLLIAVAVYEILFNDGIALYVLQALIQFLPLFLLQVLVWNTKDTVINKVVYRLRYVVILALVISIAEYALPYHYKMPIYMSVMSDKLGGSGLPDAYFVRDLDVFGLNLRPGSFFFSPLTNCIFLAISIFYSKCFFTSMWYRRCFNTLVFFVVLLGMVKSAYGFFLILLLASMFSGIFAKPLFYFGVLIICFILFYFDYGFNYFSVLGSSWGNHVIGLISGLVSVFEAPFGHGIGTAGYGVYLASKGAANSPFGALALQNGNESLLGIISYQFGVMGILIYVTWFWGLFKTVLVDYGPKNSGLIVALFIMSLYTESMSTIFLLIIIFLYSRSGTDCLANNYSVKQI